VYSRRSLEEGAADYSNDIDDVSIPLSLYSEEHIVRHTPTLEIG
jgi:hypothetical protein